MTPHARSAVVAVVGAGVIYFAADAVVRSPAFLNPRDFLEYWSAGAVVARGGNPYDPVALLAAQRQVDPDRTEAVMMWNPPWALALYVPVGLLPPRWATLVWVGLQLAAVMRACDLLWGAYGGDPRRRWVPQLLGLTSAPVAWMVLYGQNTGFLLLGLAGFLHHRVPAAGNGNESRVGQLFGERRASLRGRHRRPTQPGDRGGSRAIHPPADTISARPAKVEAVAGSFRKSRPRSEATRLIWLDRPSSTGRFVRRAAR